MTADPRATARQWLAEVHMHAECTHGYYPCADCFIDALLTAPGVEVREEVPSFDVEPGHRVPMYCVVTIRLPVQPIGEGP